ncbi:MAG: 2-succinyl-6-hydroxy-2,4-cyclohexadiene-1-carboxylate synthase [bacterium]
MNKRTNFQMIIQIDGISFNCLSEKKEDYTGLTPVVFLHGFGGSAKDWLFLFNKLPTNYYPISIDLIGHSESSSPKEIEKYSTDAIVRQINKIFTELKIAGPVLAGYSMGGRVAISYTLSNPDKVTALILESASPGIQTSIEREDRIAADELLAQKIEREGIEKFIDYWLELPLFKSLKNLKPEIFTKHRNQKLQNNPLGLANILRGFSPGRMKNYWGTLPNIKQKTLLISGRLDEKYTSVNSKAVSLFPYAHHAIVEDCGHNVHLEKPSQFIKLVSDFLNSL